MAIDQAFNATIDYYDNWIRKAVPGYDEMFAIAREATLLDQLRWLGEAGFADADCVYKNYPMGLFYAVKKA